MNAPVMSHHIFTLLVRQSTGSLERILRLIRQRGFNISYCQAKQISVEDGMSVTLELSGFRSIENLYHQLNKLIDVVEVLQLNTPKLRSILGDD